MILLSLESFLVSVWQSVVSTEPLEWITYILIGIQMFIFSLIFFDHMTRSISYGLGVIIFFLIIKFIGGYSFAYSMVASFETIINRSSQTGVGLVVLLSIFSGLVLVKYGSVKSYPNSIIIKSFQFVGGSSFAFVTVYIVYHVFF